MSKKQPLSTHRQLSPEQQKLVDVWEEHVRCEFIVKSVDDTMATMIEGAYVFNIPTMAGGMGLKGVRDFYTHSFVTQLPPDTETILISRTIGQSQIVDELIFKFTHTITMDWMLPGVAPTGNYVEIALVAIIGFNEGKISHEHIYWDQASLLAQVGLLNADTLPIIGIESAKKILDLKR